MRPHAAFLLPPALLVVVSLGMSTLLVPTDKEMALIQYKAREFEDARDRFQALVDRGDYSVGVVKPLSELHVQFGDVDEAARLLERFVESNPDDIAARRKLGLYYQYAQRPERYRDNLETLARLALSENTLRELSHIYNAEGRFEEQIDVLWLLTEHFPGQRQDFVDLAYLEAQRGRPERSLEALERLALTLPEEMDEEIVELQLNLMLDEERPEDALGAARALLERDMDAEVLTRFASLLEYKGDPARALELASGFEDDAVTHPPFLVQLTHLEIVNGRMETAFDRLLELDARGELPDLAVPSFVELALAHDEPELAFAVLEDGDLNALPDWLRAGLAERVVADGESWRARELLDRLDGPFLRSRTVLAAELANAAGLTGVARTWLERARPAALADPELRTLAYAHERFGDPARALGILETLDRRGSLPPSDLPVLARLYLELGESRRGARQLARHRNARELEASAAWALVAADSGDTEAVRGWLRATDGRPLELGLLHDLFYIGERRQDARLSLAAAERGARENPEGRLERLHLARALTAAGRADEALRLARTLLPGRGPRADDERQGYADALHAAWRAGLPVTAELSAYLAARVEERGIDAEERRGLLEQWAALQDFEAVLAKLRELTEREPDRWVDLYVETATRAGALESVLPELEELLARGRLSAKGQEVATQGLLTAGRDEEALPHLRELATSVGKHWVYLYDRALTRLERTDARRRFWLERAGTPGLTEDEVRTAAYSLIEVGERARATRLFFALAADSGPEDDDVTEYVYLASEDEPQVAADWLVGRARESEGVARARWMTHLVRLQRPERAVALVRGSELSGMHAAVRDAYVEALSASRGAAELTRVLTWSLPSERDPGRLRRLARLAFEADALSAADLVLDRLLALQPNDPDATRQAGLVAFLRGDYDRAESRLREYLASGASDYESNFYYAETLLREGRGQTARHHFERSLAHVEATSDPSFQELATRAQVLHRLGRPDEAFAAFEELLVEEPDNGHVRADYVAARLERNDYDEAERALAEFDPSGLDSGTLRLHLLQANLWARTHREREALDKLEQLRRERPDSPSVLAALASATAGSGRWLEALEDYGEAMEMAPTDDNVRDAREALWRQRGPRVGGEWLQRGVGDAQSQRITTVATRTRLGTALELGLSYRRTEATLSLPGATEGRSTRSGRLDHAELHLRHDLSNGIAYRAALHALARRPGFSFSAHRESFGRGTDLTAELQVPFWDVIGGVIDDARRDRIRVEHRETLTKNLRASGSLSAQRYGSSLGDGLSRSWAAAANLSYDERLDDTLVSLSYLFDAEYFDAVDGSAAPEGRSSTLFLGSREVHAPGVWVTSRLSKRFRPGGFAGYSWDRLGGAAPFFGLHAEYELSNGWFSRVAFERRLYRLDTAQAESNLRVTLHWSF